MQAGGWSNWGIIMISTFINLKTNVLEAYLLIIPSWTLEGSIILRKIIQGPLQHILSTSYLMTDFGRTWRDGPKISGGILNETLLDSPVWKDWALLTPFPGPQAGPCSSPSLARPPGGPKAWGASCCWPRTQLPVVGGHWGSLGGPGGQWGRSLGSGGRYTSLSTRGPPRPICPSPLSHGFGGLSRCGFGSEGLNLTPKFWWICSP